MIEIETIFSEESLRKLESIIGGFGPSHRAALLLFYRLGFDLKQIEKMMDLPLAKVSKSLGEIEARISIGLPEIEADDIKDALKTLPEHEYEPLNSMPATGITQGLQDLSGRQRISWKLPLTLFVVIILIMIIWLRSL